MVYVKRRGMVLLVDDSQVSKYTSDGFEILDVEQKQEPDKKAVDKK